MHLPGRQVSMHLPLLSPALEKQILATQSDRLPDTVQAIYFGRPLWSPDGRALAFAGAFETQNSALYVYQPGDKAPRRLTDGAEQAVLVAWSPDSQWLLYETLSPDYAGQAPAVQSVWAIPAASGAPTKLYDVVNEPTEAPKFLGWSPAGEAVMFMPDVDGGTNAVCVALDPATGKATVWQQGEFGDMAFDPQTGTLALIPISINGPDSIELVYPDGKKVLPADTSGKIWPSIEFLPGIGRFYAYGVDDVILLAYDGTLVSLPDEAAQQIEERPAVSPDGKWLAFWNEHSGGVRLYAANGELALVVSVREGWASIQAVSWRPDSGSIYIAADKGLFLATLAEGRPVLIANRVDLSVTNLLPKDPANLGWVLPGSQPQGAPTPASLARPLSLTSPRMSGEDVRLLQQRLLALGYTEAGPADGVFGLQTDAAVRHFQQDWQLTVDGVVGPVTWAALWAAPADAPPSAEVPAATATPGKAQAPTPTASPAPVIFPLRADELAVDVAVAGSQVWVLTAEALRRIDPVTGTQIEEQPVAPFARRLLIAGGRLWYVNAADDTGLTGYAIYTRDLVTGQVSRLPIGQSLSNPPCDLAFDGARLWVAWCDQGQVQAFDLAALPEQAARPSISVGPEAYGLVFDGVRVWAEGRENLYVIDPVANTVLQALPFSGMGRLIYDGTRVWVSTGERLVAVDPATGQTVQSFPRRFASSLGGGRLWGWEAPPGSHANMPYRIWVMDLETGTFTFPLTLTDYPPLATAYDGARLWYINARDSWLYYLPMPK